MKIILIGGTPGTGKSTVASILGARMKRQVIDLGQLAREKGCLGEHDEERGTYIIDEDCLVDAIESLLDESQSDLIIEGHYIDLIPSRQVERAYILRAHPEQLRGRLIRRSWSEKKVSENVEAEVFGVCQLDALYAFGEDRVYEIDTSARSPEDVASRILQLNVSKKRPIRIDWMEELERDGRLDEFVKSV